MAGKEARQAHGRHNERVCDHLHEKGDCPDWVVTTAFYAALHYAEHHLFPREGKPLGGQEREFETFESWYRATVKPGATETKHEALHRLVRLTCPGDVSSSYRALLDNSYNARYNHYVVDPKIAEKARRDLARVRDYCCPAAAQGVD